MHRAWKHAVAALAALWLLMLPRAALAFHIGSDYDKPPGAGGGGGLFYTGAPAERGFTCAACHTGAPGNIRVSLSEASGSLLSSLTYTPGTTYALTATLVGDTTTIDHFDAIAVSIVDDAGAPIGSIGGFSSDDFYQSSNGTIASVTRQPNVTSWNFSWTAPVTGAGRAHLHVAAVAGNAAGLPGLTLTDPFGDDVFAGTLDLDPDTTTGSRDASSSSYAWAGLAGCVFFRKRRWMRDGGRR
jgi:hypothetical protein